MVSSDLDDLDPYLRGERLYGDDFRPDQLEKWFEQEREAYAGLGDKGISSGDGMRYTRHALNQHHGYRHLPPGRIDRALGVGSFRGAEFTPIRDRIGELPICEPSDVAESTEVLGIPTRYVKPRASGELPFADESFDLITCFGALHHVANVSKVVAEMARCLVPGGYALIREPIVSMGDWRHPRAGLTVNERGIPLRLFRELIAGAGLRVEREGLCIFPPLQRLGRRFLGVWVYNIPMLTALDELICRLVRLNLRYHATTRLQKVRPVSAFYVLCRADS